MSANWQSITPSANCQEHRSMIESKHVSQIGHLPDSRISARPVTAVAQSLPFLPNVFALRSRSDREARSDQGVVARYQENSEVPSAASGRIRPRSVAALMPPLSGMRQGCIKRTRSIRIIPSHYSMGSTRGYGRISEAVVDSLHVSLFVATGISAW